MLDALSESILHSHHVFLPQLHCAYSDVVHAVDLCRVVGGGVKSWAGLLSLEMAGGLYLDVLGKGGYWRKSRISLGIRVGIEELALDLE